MTKCLRLAVPAILAFFLLCISTLAQQAPPSADTFVSSSTPSTNYGSSIILVVASGNNTYMKFNLSGVPTGPSVSKATLRLFVDAVVTGGQFDVYNLPSTPTWSESTLKYSTPPPALGASATGGHPVTLSTSSYNTFVLIDITSTVQGWLTNPSSNNGVALALIGSTGWFSFDSKESFLTAHQPELEIVLNGPAGSQGATGATGATGPTGATGATGPKGDTGATGAIGPQGSKGDTGATGAIGPQGSKGDTGATGAIGPQGNKGDTGATGATGATGPQGLKGDTGPQGATGAQGSTGPQGSPGMIGMTGAQGPAGAQGPQGPAGTGGTDPNSRMIFPSFFPGNLSGTWVGGQFILDQAITVLRIAATAKTPTGAGCPAAVFRFTDGAKGQDLALTPGQYWSDSGPMVLTFAAGSTLKASLRTGSTCASNTGADANLLVEYKMQATGDTDSCLGTSCSGICTTTSSDPANCGSCGIACASGIPCTGGTCGSSGGGCSPPQTLCGTTCTNTSSDPNNCGACGQVCPMGNVCSNGTCGSSSSACVSNGVNLPAGTVVSTPFGTCQQLQCDGNGHVISVVDNSNPPTSTTCLPAFCNAGVPTAVPAPAGTACGVSSTCDGIGNCVASCSFPQTACGSICTNLTSDPLNCGACGRLCVSAPNESAVCAQGGCSGVCNAGFADCDGNPANGCEINIINDPKDCGVCGNVCASGQSCNNGTCTASASVCGNGIREAGEQCDDSNTTNLDGCSSTCQFEQNQRIISLQLMGTMDSFCAQNQLGSRAFTTTALSQFNPVLNTNIAAGAVTEILTFLGLTDLTGTTTQASFQLGMVGGTPVAGAGYSGSADLDWWYTVDPTTVDGSRVAKVQVPASIAASVLTAGPGTINFPSLFSTVPATLPFVNANLSVPIEASSAPTVSSSGNPPGHLAAENLDPTIRSFASMGQQTTAPGKLCGTLSAATLAAAPIPGPLLSGGASACVAAGSNSHAYTSVNSMLDLLVGGCETFGGFVTLVNPAQPDVVLSGSNITPLLTGANSIASCNGTGDISCLTKEGYSSYLQFTADRVIVK
jgi:cysteine-rich repeat protein